MIFSLETSFLQVSIKWTSPTYLKLCREEAQISVKKALLNIPTLQLRIQTTLTPSGKCLITSLKALCGSREARRGRMTSISPAGTSGGDLIN
jgi:hypothetical protein